MEALPYLRPTITYKNSDWKTVYQNLRKARRRWVMIARVMANTEATVQAHEIMYKEVDQSVLLYGSEIWVVTGDMLKVLEGLHHRADMHITGMTAKHGVVGEW